jgi:5'-3' exonuclease
MGIKHFFTWFRTEFPSAITSFHSEIPPEDIKIDTFMIDLNGVFHNSAQKVYQYGNHARPKSMMGRKTPNVNTQALTEKCFAHVCLTIEQLLMVAKPTKRLVLCIDGVAPLSKQNQQRQRRYRGAVEDPSHFFDTNTFDTCNITPGTKFMDNLSRYIDWYIHKQINSTSQWGSIEVIFSNEKVPGEGEHKLINFIRKYGQDDETFCINALDADLVMLSLATQKKNFYLLREDLYSSSVDYMYVNIGVVRDILAKSTLHWECKDCADNLTHEKNLVDDFVLICFLCGNDFLPNIPSIAIMDKGMDTIISLYRSTCASEGHLVDPTQNKFRIKPFQTFLRLLGSSEKGLLEQKIKNRNDYIPEPLLEKYASSDFNFEAYKAEYYQHKNMHSKLTEMCHAYLDGCQWVLSYYTRGIKDWTWIYPFNYSPFATDLAESMLTYEFKEEKETKAMLPFEQLLCVLPPKSSKLVPAPLCDLFQKGSSLSKYYPDTFVINYEGKKKTWEGVVELPVVDVQAVQTVYRNIIGRVSCSEIRRNVPSENILYKFSVDFPGEFQSSYGNIPFCRVGTEIIEF